MATDLEKLVVQLSADFRQFEKSMARAADVSNKQFNAIERRARQLNKNLDSIGRQAAQSFVAPLAGIGAALGAAEIIRLTNTWTDLTSRVNLAAGSMEKGGEVMERIGEIARRTYSSLEQTAESFISNSTALKDLGYSTDQQLDYTEALNNALVISAAKGDRAASIQNALAKAMAGGKLAGDDLNTVIQTGGRVAQALAAGLGVGINQLRKLGAEGKITSSQVFRALTSQMEKLRKEAEAMPATIADGIQLLRNALLQYVGNADQATGVTAKISEALVIMADNFDKTADVALQLAAVIAGALIGRSLLKMITTLGLAGTALASFTRALAAARTMGGLATAFGGLSAAAGPVGLVIGGAVVASLVAFSAATTDAHQAAKTYADALEIVREKANGAGGAIEAATAKIDEKTKNLLTQGIEQGVAEIDAARQAVLDYLDQIDQLASRRLATEEQYAQLRQLREGLNSNKKSTEDVEQAIHALANSNPNFRALADQITPLIVALREAMAATDLLKQKLGASGGVASAYKQYGESRMAGNAIEVERSAYEKEALRKATLGKQQLALEKAIAEVRKESLADGITLTEDQINRIAQARVAGDAARSGEGKKTRTKAPKKTADDQFDNLTQSINDRIVAMRLEQETLGMTFKEQQKRAVALDLEQEALRQVREEARKKGDQDWKNAQLSPDQRAQIDAVSEAYARQADSLREATAAQELQRDVLKGAFSDLRSALEDGKLDWKDIGDIAMNALDKIINKIEDDLIDAILQANSAAAGGGSGGGIFGWITKGLGSLFGGGAGATTDPWAGMRFDKGGYTGPGGKYQPAGVVHKGEYVFDQQAVRGAGGPAALDAMRRNMRGYANGGLVGAPKLTAPRMPDVSSLGRASSSGVTVTVAPVISMDLSGTQPGVGAEVEAAIKKATGNMTDMVVKSLREIKVKGIRV